RFARGAGCVKRATGLLKCRRDPAGGSYQPDDSNRVTGTTTARSRRAWLPQRRHRNRASLPRDFIRIPQRPHNGFAIFSHAFASARTRNFSRLIVRGSRRREPTTSSVSPGARARTASRNFFDGSYAVTSLEPSRKTTCPPGRVLAGAVIRPTNRPAVPGTRVGPGITWSSVP